MREFKYVDEMASATIFVMNLGSETYQRETQPTLDHINARTGIYSTINYLTETVDKVVGYQGEIHWDTTKPDGTPRKLVDLVRLERLGWKSHVSLEDGLTRTYLWSLQN